MPVLVEKYATGALGFCTEGEAFPCKSWCFGESSKRQGKAEESEGFVEE
jgi:hypothetical protein